MANAPILRTPLRSIGTNTNRIKKNSKKSAVKQKENFAGNLKDYLLSTKYTKLDRTLLYALYERDGAVTAANKSCLEGLIGFVTTYLNQENHSDHDESLTALIIQILGEIAKSLPSLNEYLKPIHKILLQVIFSNCFSLDFELRTAIIASITSSIKCEEEGRICLEVITSFDSRHEFLSIGSTRYFQWIKEIERSCKYVPWIFLRSSNTIGKQQLLELSPKCSPLRISSSNIEEGACQYLKSHFLLILKLTSFQAGKQSRNEFRSNLKGSGLERVISDKLRKVSFTTYKSLYKTVSRYIKGALLDEWPINDMQFGSAHISSPKKVHLQWQAPKLQDTWSFP